MTWLPEEYQTLYPAPLPPNVEAIRNALDLANLRFLKHSEFPVIEADYEKELAWLLDEIGVTVLDPTAVDYRRLLWKYLQHVSDCEGITFAHQGHSISPEIRDRLTAEDIAELDRLVDMDEEPT